MEFAYFSRMAWVAYGIYVFLENGVGCLWNLRISRGCLWNSHAGVITWVGCLRVDEGVAALVGLEFRRCCR